MVWGESYGSIWTGLKFKSTWNVDSLGRVVPGRGESMCWCPEMWVRKEYPGMCEEAGMNIVCVTGRCWKDRWRWMKLEEKAGAGSGWRAWTSSTDPDASWANRPGSINNMGEGLPVSTHNISLSINTTLGKWVSGGSWVCIYCPIGITNVITDFQFTNPICCPLSSKTTIYNAFYFLLVASANHFPSYCPFTDGSVIGYEGV